MVGQSRAKDLLVDPVALVEAELGISGLLGEGAFLVGGLEAIAQSHLVEDVVLDRRRRWGSRLSEN